MPSHSRPAVRDARYRKARKAGRLPIVSEGDSWFDYPMYKNLIDHVDATNRFAIYRLEFCGDTVTNMVGNGSSWRGLNALRDIVEAEQPRLFLFSGGGNDIVGSELKNAIKDFNPNDSPHPPEWYLDTSRWRELSAGVEQAYRRLIETIGPLAPVMAHGYDHIIPSHEKVKYDGVAVGGPWVIIELERAGLPAALHSGVAKAMMTWFNDMLGDLAREFPAYFSYINLRNTLEPEDWENEIHPTRDGFRKLADKFIAEIDKKLKPLLVRHTKDLAERAVA